MNPTPNQQTDRLLPMGFTRISQAPDSVPSAQVSGQGRVADDSKDWTIEPHGPEGQFALYEGRNGHLHGLRLCNLSDFDGNREKTLRAILEGHSALRTAPTLQATVVPSVERIEFFIRSHYGTPKDSVDVICRRNLAHELQSELLTLTHQEPASNAGEEVARLREVENEARYVQQNLRSLRGAFIELRERSKKQDKAWMQTFVECADTAVEHLNKVVTILESKL